MRRALAVAAFACVAQSAAGVDGVTIGTSAPRAVASLFDQPNVYVSKAEDAEALGVVKASGSFYIPRAVGAGQLLPNKIDISCFKDHCYVAAATLQVATLSLSLELVPVRQWSSERVVAEDDTAPCAKQVYELDLVARRVIAYKLAKPGVDEKVCGATGQSSYVMVLASVHWEGR
jgi:hypothetical protein